jgi:hypothetical protein
MAASFVQYGDPFPERLIMVETTQPFEGLTSEVNAWIVENGDGLFFGHADLVTNRLCYWFTDQGTAFWFKIKYC